MSNTYEIYHHGVKGMKWGVRKDKIRSRVDSERQYRDKLKKASVTAEQAGDLSTSRRLKYRSQNLAVRTAKTAVSIASTDAIGIFLKGGSAANMKMMTGKDWVRTGLYLAGRTATMVTYKDALAKSASKRYDQSGKQIKKEGIVSKEDAIDFGVRTAATGAMAARMFYRGKVSKTRAQQAKGRQWAGNVLEDRAGKTITLDPSQYRILNN